MRPEHPGARGAPALLVAGLLVSALASAAGGAPEDPEAARVPAARAALPGVFDRVDDGALAGVRSVASARARGDALWRAQTAAVRARADFDDRPLYWSRLASRAAFAADCAAALDCAAILDAFEWASRGAEDVAWSADAPLRILISGFDPFFLDRDIGQSNPSGLAAQALDGTVLEVDGQRAEVQAVVVPVRYGDFDEGRIEALLGPHLDDVDLLVTISMGRSDFDLERFPGRRRSAEAPGNRNVVTGASATDPRVPRLDDMPLPGPEFVEFSLPAAAMTKVQTPYAVNDNRTVTTLERGTFDADSLAELADQTAVRGGGGGYLSNEISFRTVRLAHTRGLDLAVGHLHTPSIRGFDAEALDAIVTQIRAILEAAVPALEPRTRND